MKKIILFTFLLFIVFNLCGKQVVTLQEVMKPAMMVVKYNKLYVLEKTTIYIYSLKDFRLVKTFGREGEGPKEFMARPFGPPMSMSFLADNLVINSNNKLSYFTGDGEYLKERKAPPNIVFYQIKDQFVGIGPSFDKDKRMRISFRLFTPDFKEKKVLHQSEVTVRAVDSFELPMSAITYNPIYKDKIIIAASVSDFVIDIFDHDGNKIRRIEKEFEKLKITDEYKKETHAWFKNESLFKQFYDAMKNNIKFKNYYPAIRDIHLADDTIHVVTFKRKNNLWECILLDMKGKELKRLYVPLSRYIPYTYYAILYSADKGKLYSLVEDEDEEVWKLHVLNTR